MNAAEIESAKYRLTEYRSPEGGLVLDRYSAIELLLFLQRISEYVNDLENALSVTPDYGSEEVQKNESNVVELFPKN